MRRRRRGAGGDSSLICHIPMTSDYAIGQTLLDIAGGNHAPASGNPVIGADDTTFDGTDAFTIPSSFNDTFKGDFSICIWLKPDEVHPAATNYTIGDYVDTSGRQYIGMRTDGKIWYEFWGNNDSELVASDSAVFPDGATDRTHITITGDQSAHEFKMYINGVLEPTSPLASITSGNWALYNSTTNQYFLGDFDNATGQYVGKQKDFRIFNRIITTDEMLQIVNE